MRGRGRTEYAAPQAAALRAASAVCASFVEAAASQMSLDPSPIAADSTFVQKWIDSGDSTPETAMIRKFSSAALALALAMVATPSVQAQRGFTKGPQLGSPVPNTQPRSGHYFNPKEITIDKPVPWQKSKSGPKGITTCVTPGSRRPVRC